MRRACAPSRRLAVVAMRRRRCARSLDAAPSRWSSSSTPGPGGGNDVLARAIVTMVEKEKLLPVRMQVVNKPGGNGAVAAAPLAEKKDDPHTIGLITSALDRRPAHVERGEDHRARPEADRAALLEPAVFAVRADSPFKTLEGLHRRGEGEAGRAQAVRRLGDLARQHHAPDAAARDRRALGVHLVPGRRRAPCRAARRPRRHHGHRAAGSGRAGARGQAARAGAAQRTPPAGLSRSRRR